MVKVNIDFETLDLIRDSLLSHENARKALLHVARILKEHDDDLPLGVADWLADAIETAMKTPEVVIPKGENLTWMKIRKRITALINEGETIEEAIEEVTKEIKLPKKINKDINDIKDDIKEAYKKYQEAINNWMDIGKRITLLKEAYKKYQEAIEGKTSIDWMKIGKRIAVLISKGKTKEEAIEEVAKEIKLPKETNKNIDDIKDDIEEAYKKYQEAINIWMDIGKRITALIDKGKTIEEAIKEVTAEEAIEEVAKETNKNINDIKNDVIKAYKKYQEAMNDALLINLGLKTYNRRKIYDWYIIGSRVEELIDEGMKQTHAIKQVEEETKILYTNIWSAYNKYQEAMKEYDRINNIEDDANDNENEKKNTTKEYLEKRKEYYKKVGVKES